MISVVIPTYNRCESLLRALDSVQKQDLPPTEIIVIDDGSTDGTRIELARRYPDVRYVYQENQGVSAARNKGIAMAGGAWIALLDSDDTWLPNKLAEQWQALQREPTYRWCHTHEIWIRNGVRVNEHKKHAKQGGWIYQACLPLCAVSPSSVLIHRDIFAEIGVFDVDLPACEDYDLWLRIAARFPVLYIPARLTVKYGGHADQLSQTHWGMDRFRITALEKVLATEVLSIADRTATLHMLLKKVRIFLRGAYKHNNQREIAIYEEKQRKYSKFTP